MSTMALQLPSSFVDVERDEMEYVDGGNAYEWAVGIACSLIANAVTAIVKRVVTQAMVDAALTACSGAASAVWAGISSAAAFIWNTPVALAIVAGTVGVGAGIVIGYYGFR